jgi:hypothetical protein
MRTARHRLGRPTAAALAVLLVLAPAAVATAAPPPAAAPARAAEQPDQQSDASTPGEPTGSAGLPAPQQPGTDAATPSPTAPAEPVDDAGNQAPVARPDLAAVVAGASVVVDVLANDSDPDGDPLVLVDAGEPGSGTAVVDDGFLVYTAAGQSARTDSVTYTVSDGQGGTAQATVTITVHVPTAAHVLSRADVSPEPVVARATTTITSSAQTRYSDGVLRPTPAGTAADVLFRASGTTTFVVWATVAVAPAGRVQATLHPRQDGEWRVRIGTVQSAGDTVDVHTPTSAHRVGAANAFREPATSGRPVTVLAPVRTKYSDGVWRPTPAGTTFSVWFRPSGGVTYRKAATGKVGTAGEARLQVTPTRDGSWRVALGSAVGGADFVDVIIPASAGLNAVVSGPLTRSDVPYSYRSGCPVGPSSLRRITLNYRDYAGLVQRGDLIVRSSAVSDLRYVFGKAWDAKFPIKRMLPADSYYAGGTVSPTTSDKRAMNAGNTSAFNCRPVTGNPYRTSAHSYGIAIDINTWENPYVTASAVYPAGATEYLKRSPYRTGMIVTGGPVAKAMSARGWPWGARWRYPDYQHFSATGA